MMKLHSKEDIIALAKSLAQQVVSFRRKHCEEVEDKFTCHELDLINQQAEQILVEFDDENYGDC